MELSAKVVSLHEALALAKIEHAIGGAIALAYCIEEPRATRDVDINVFVGVKLAREVFEALPRGVAWNERDLARCTRDAQIRLHWGEHPVDIFFMEHEFLVDARRHVVTVPFERAHIPVLGCVHLAVLKAFFARSKDWTDIEFMIQAGLNVAEVARWLTLLLGPNDERIARLHELVRTLVPVEEPNFRRILNESRRTRDLPSI